MLVLLAGVVFAYNLPLEPLTYDIQVDFDGYLPVLGGTERPAQVHMALEVRGLPHGESGPLSAASSLREFRILLKDRETGHFQPLPLSIDNVRGMFPDTTIELTRQGKVLKSDAPAASIPIRLPGIDFRRLPEMTYLLLEFPSGELSEGESWAFTRDIDASEAKFTATYLGEEAGAHSFVFTLHQVVVSHEDRFGNHVESSDGAWATVRTVISGKGTVSFSGYITSAMVTAEADSTVTSKDAGSPTTRKLRSAVSLSLRK